MSGYEKRLDNLAKIRPSPAPPTKRDPVRWDWLSEADRADWEEITAAYLAVDVGPAPLDERAELRKRLDGLTDDQLDRLATLCRRVDRLSRETTP